MLGVVLLVVLLVLGVVLLAVGVNKTATALVCVAGAIYCDGCSGDASTGAAGTKQDYINTCLCCWFKHQQHNAV